MKTLAFALTIFAASTAFVVDIIVSVAVTMVTAPKPAAELVGLVYSETPRESFQDPESVGKPWYLRPVPLDVPKLTRRRVVERENHRRSSGRDVELLVQ